MPEDSNAERGRLYDLRQSIKRTLPKPEDYPALSRIIKNLNDNADRMAGLAFLPTYLVTVSMMTQKLYSQAALEASNGRTTDIEELTAKEQRQCMAAYAILLDKHRSKSPKEFRRFHKRYEVIFDSIVEQMSGDSQSGFQASVLAVVANAWTTFESVASDLWEEAVNLRPNPLALCAIHRTVKNNDDAAEGIRQQKLRFLSSLIKEEPSTVASAGLIIRKVNKFDFTSFDGIKQAYTAAFVNKKMEAIFSGPSFSDLVVLEGVRHVLVHRGGEVDARYLVRVSANRKRYKRFGLDQCVRGDSLPINGTIAKQFAESSVKACAALVRRVGSYLSRKSA